MSKHDNTAGSYSPATKTVFFAALFALIVVPLFARDITVLVHDEELHLPLEGAAIRSWDGAQYTCDNGGIATVAVPDDRQVLIHAAYPGYESGRLVISLGENSYALGLRLSGIMEGREMVIEAAQPGASETKTGRSVAVSGREIAQTAEISIIEDVMSSVKLLPGVGYAGFFNAMPSIRGGDPGDMGASLDGYYVPSPYHWGGGFSIFDPRMVQSAQLSHGVFSSRYGHTLSGLLEVTSKKPSPTETEFELGVNTSAASFSLSLPLAGKGGILAMGRVTYYDPIIALAKEVAKSVEELEMVNSIRVAPYIRSGTITGNYRFLHNLELQATGFWGMDGIGVTFEDSFNENGLDSNSVMMLNWTNYQGFFTTGLSWNPRNDMLLKLSVGTGYQDAVVDGKTEFNINKKNFSSDFDEFWDGLSGLGLIDEKFYDLAAEDKQNENILLVNAQGRIDYDWELGSGFLAALGVQERFVNFIYKSNSRFTFESPFYDLDQKDKDDISAILGDSNTFPYYNNLMVQFPSAYSASVDSKLFTTSAYALMEYNSPGNRFGAELGLRVDHYYLLGKDFTIPFKPAFNPRLNLDFNVFKNSGLVQSFDINAGTGLFSSLDNIIFNMEKRFNLTDGKPSRSWTSVLGSKVAFSEGLSLNIEGYYKHIFDRTYIPVDAAAAGLTPKPYQDGEGRVWGIDVMLQKLQSRYWDGWLSYSYNWAKYRDPNGTRGEMGLAGGTSGDDWYFPDYHRFHNLNLVLNIKPTPNINIYTRFGFASGVQISRLSDEGPKSYPVYVHNPGGKSYFIEKYFWQSEPDENNRSTPALPMDVKLSIFGKSASGKARYEVYVAVENVLALVYNAQGNAGFNEYTGEKAEGNAASYDIPIPIPSFGFKYTY